MISRNGPFFKTIRYIVCWRCQLRPSLLRGCSRSKFKNIETTCRLYTKRKAGSVIIGSENSCTVSATEQWPFFQGWLCINRSIICIKTINIIWCPRRIVITFRISVNGDRSITLTYKDIVFTGIIVITYTYNSTTRSGSFRNRTLKINPEIYRMLPRSFYTFHTCLLYIITSASFDSRT